MRIVITGASGFIGKELLQHLAQKHEVIALQRNVRSSTPSVTYRAFDLTDDNTFAAIDDAEAVVHCAFIRFGKEHRDAFDQNVEGAVALAKRCIERNIHFIFLSTMSAHDEALSQYGKHKFEIERRLAAMTGLTISPGAESPKGLCVLKLGLVIGSSGGLFHTISETIKKTSVIPLIDGGGQPIQGVHISDLCRIIEKIAVEKISGTFNIGSPEVYTLKELYNAIAASANKELRFISLPFWMMNMMLSTIEAVGVNLSITTENLLGLKQLQAFKTSTDLEKLGMKLMGLQDAIDRR